MDTDAETVSVLAIWSAMRGAVATLAEMPRCGQLYQKMGEHEVRQYRVRGTPYSVYYIVDDDSGQLVVVSAWSRMRGKGPSL